MTPYTADRPETPSREELKARIPGWGVDLDPKNRPSYPKEVLNLDTGAHWEFPDRQIQRWRREKSPEHRFVTPVFGTACPPKGLSGIMRKYAYRLSEGRATHWLLLIAADRVDVIESRLGAITKGRPDNPIKESGIAAEVRYNGLESRRGQHRADLVHQPLDIGLMLAPYAALGFAAYKAARYFSQPPKRRRRRKLISR